MISRCMRNVSVYAFHDMSMARSFALFASGVRPARHYFQVFASMP